MKKEKTEPVEVTDLRWLLYTSIVFAVLAGMPFFGLIESLGALWFLVLLPFVSFYCFLCLLGYAGYHCFLKDLASRDRISRNIFVVCLVVFLLTLVVLIPAGQFISGLRY